MKTPILYLETSIFGFYFDDESRNLLKREAVIALFNQMKLDIFKGVISPITIRELSKTPSPFAQEFLSLLDDLNVEPLSLNSEEIEHLAQEYIREGIIPAELADDARHIAYATIGKVDVLVSLNLKHIVNEWAIRGINSVNLRKGYMLLSIRTPEEVIKYED